MGKIKRFIESETGKDVIVVLIVILVGLGSFMLGRLSKNSQNSGIKVTYPNQEANVASALESELGNKIPSKVGTANTNGKNFFASNRGTKYYPVGCEGGKSIKQENKVYFNTSAEAETAGYELSSSCK